MRRRLDLAASLIAEPPTLFLDEPTTELDSESRNTAWKVIRSLVRGGTARRDVVWTQVQLTWRVPTN